jgi:hypothetical protein
VRSASGAACSAIPCWTTAILDRLPHHSQVITIPGDSYRLREQRRSGLIKAALGDTVAVARGQVKERREPREKGEYQQPPPCCEARRRGRKPQGETPADRGGNPARYRLAAKPTNWRPARGEPQPIRRSSQQMVRGGRFTQAPGGVCGVGCAARDAARLAPRRGHAGDCQSRLMVGCPHREGGSLLGGLDVYPGYASKPTVLYSFCAKNNCTDGAFPFAGLIAEASGNLFGTTELGGTSDNCFTQPNVS